MTDVVVTGAAGEVGRRVLALVAEDPSVDRLVGIDRVAVAGAPPGVELITADLAAADLEPIFAGADVVLHLASNPLVVDETTAPVDVLIAGRVLEAAGVVATPHVLVRSSATVYGAWPDNPVPLTEDAPLRPNPDLGWAVERAEIERLVDEWRSAHPDAIATVLRPAITVAQRSMSWLAEAMRATANIRAGDQDDPPLQFLHIDDLASAIDIARIHCLDGPVNVAPDGWIPGETVRALAGGGPRLRLPASLATRFASWRWRKRLAPTPPGLVPYTQHPWVVANDKLTAAGWKPEYSNEEAYVEGHEARVWADLSPRRRQEIALGVTGAAVVAAVVACVAALRRRARR